MEILVQKLSHSSIEKQQKKIAASWRRKLYASRSCILSSFNLIEAYLNGVAWDFLNYKTTSHLSNRQQKLLEDTSGTSIRDKVIKYPEITTGKHLWTDQDEPVKSILLSPA